KPPPQNKIFFSRPDLNAATPATQVLDEAAVMLLSLRRGGESGRRGGREGRL
ncbi:hypothetical protein KUCAC02_034611, partial [Chaenocephalus aceratus]